MKLSEAIRLGAMMKPQGFGWYDDGVATCAVGAALDAAGGSVADAVGKWPIMMLAPATCPECAHIISGEDGIYATGAMIVHLNDYHRWTRERIAAFVETIEQSQADDAVASPITVSHV